MANSHTRLETCRHLAGLLREVMDRNPSPQPRACSCTDICLCTEYLSWIALIQQEKEAIQAAFRLQKMLEVFEQNPLSNEDEFAKFSESVWEFYIQTW